MNLILWNLLSLIVIVSCTGSERETFQIQNKYPHHAIETKYINSILRAGQHRTKKHKKKETNNSQNKLTKGQVSIKSNQIKSINVHTTVKPIQLTITHNPKIIKDIFTNQPVTEKLILEKSTSKTRPRYLTKAITESTIKYDTITNPKPKLESSTKPQTNTKHNTTTKTQRRRRIYSTTPRSRVIDTTLRSRVIHTTTKKPQRKKIQTATPKSRVVHTTTPRTGVVYATTSQSRLINTTPQLRVIHSTTPRSKVIYTSTPRSKVINTTTPRSRMVHTTPRSKVIYTSTPRSKVINTTPRSKVINTTTPWSRMVHTTPLSKVIRSTTSSSTLRYTTKAVTPTQSKIKRTTKAVTPTQSKIKRTTKSRSRIKNTLSKTKKSQITSKIKYMTTTEKIKTTQGKRPRTNYVHLNQKETSGGNKELLNSQTSPKKFMENGTLYFEHKVVRDDSGKTFIIIPFEDYDSKVKTSEQMRNLTKQTSILEAERLTDYYKSKFALQRTKKRIGVLSSHSNHLVYLEHFGRYACTGVLIYPQWVLSVASCYLEFHPLFNRGKMNSGTIFRHWKVVTVPREHTPSVEYIIKKIIVHEGFNTSWNWNNDIALIKTQDKMKFNEYLQPTVMMPSQITHNKNKNHNNQLIPKKEAFCYVLDVEELHNKTFVRVSPLLNLQVTRFGNCIKQLGDDSYKISSNMYCVITPSLYPADLVRTDGAGVFYKGRLTALTSSIGNSAEYHAKNSKLAVVTDITVYEEWIYEHIHSKT